MFLAFVTSWFHVVVSLSETGFEKEIYSKLEMLHKLFL